MRVGGLYFFVDACDVGPPAEEIKKDLAAATEGEEEEEDEVWGAMTMVAVIVRETEDTGTGSVFLGAYLMLYLSKAVSFDAQIRL